MLSIERTKELLNDPTISDKEVEEIRAGFQALTQVILEKWQADKEKLKKINNSE